jgi:hypothetical protein
MTLVKVPGRKETDLIIGEARGVGVGPQLMQQANVIVGGNALGKSALVEAQLAARQQHSTAEAAFTHILEAERSAASNKRGPRRNDSRK